MLRALYEGKQELFEGLYIRDKWGFSWMNPTLVIYLNQMSLRDVGLEQSLKTILRNEARRYELLLESGFYVSRTYCETTRQDGS